MTNKAQIGLFDLDIWDNPEPEQKMMLVRNPDNFRLEVIPDTRPSTPRTDDFINGSCPICHGRGTDGYGRPCRKCNQ
jgi:hypothetical protein